MIGYIYIHTSPFNKSYIGQTRQKDVNKRWQRGNGYLKNNQNNPISKAIKKYGWKNFKHDILEIVEEKDEEKLIYKLNQLEEDYILKLNTLTPFGYNLETRGKSHITLNSTRIKMSNNIKNRAKLKGAYILPNKFICKNCGKEIISKDKNLARARKRFNNRNLCKICKTKETYKLKSGFESPLQNPIILEKKNKTIEERYGKNYNPMKNENIKNKLKKTMLKRYNVKFYTEILNKKRKIKMKTQMDRDKLYLDIAKRYSQESSCLRRQVGCVITVDNRMVVAGWNGAPKGITSCKEKNQCMRENSKSGENLQTCLSCHSEMNAITQASRMGISIKNGTLYCTHKPCSLCSKLIINCGIIRVVYENDYPETLGEELLKEAKVELIKID